MPKKKEVPMPKLESQKNLAKKKVFFYSWVAVIGFVVMLACLALWAREDSKKTQTNYIPKGVAVNYVCKVVGADPDQDVVAVQCYTE